LQGPGAGSMTLSYDEISEILKLIDESSCDEFVLETGDIKLVVRRRGAGGTGASIESANTTSIVPSPAAPIEPAPRPITARSGANVVPAPMVGTFYRSPSPGAPPFVEVGSRVTKGDPICIIEVMKLFTTIHAEWSGTVTEIGAENASLVEYGQMLFVIVPD
jgi:acetyl-CoA carboxylase biotin carboxyl carrier protein